MKIKTSLLCIFIIGLIFSSSCKVSYIAAYQTYLDGNLKPSLQFQDSIIKISFDPRPNGIFFDIENLSNNNLYLIWDKSYFVEPSGNSSKLLNTDILVTTSVIREKENYESVIPQGSHFSRFTCSAKNISKFSRFNSVTFYNEISKTINTNMDYSEIWLTGNYWYLGQKRKYFSAKEIPNLDKLETEYVQKYIANNNNLGLGFTLKDKGHEIEYHFKLLIKKVTISKKTGNDFLYQKSYDLEQTNGFKPVKIEPNNN